MAMSDGGSYLVAMSTHTHTPPSLKAILTRFRTRISISFGFLTVENVVEVATPFLLGLAIDGLLSGSAGEIWLLAGILVLGTITGTGRRLFDTRAYTDIHVQLADETAAHGWRTGLAISALNARTELLPMVFQQFVRIREISQRMAQQGDADPSNSAASKPSSGATSGRSLQGRHQPG